MATWQQFTEEAPELAAAVRARLEATKHHVIATVRRDGSPRVSGTEVGVTGPDLTAGSMPGARKARDLQRDGRCAIHANPGDGSMSEGDAKVSGTAVEVADAAAHLAANGGEEQPGPFHLFRIELSEAVLTTVEGDELVISRWAPGEPVRRFARN